MTVDSHVLRVCLGGAVASKAGTLPSFDSTCRFGHSEEMSEDLPVRSQVELSSKASDLFPPRHWVSVQSVKLAQVALDAPRDLSLL
jgi:hypothetical protein